MTCRDLQNLYDWWRKQEIKVGSDELVQVVCNECNRHEVCPSVSDSEYDARQEHAPATESRRVESKTSRS